MSDYVIMTDSSCDLPASLADEMELTVLPLYVDVDGQKYTNYLDEREISFKDIYAKLRTKCPAKTSAVNVNDFMGPMEAALKAGRDVLYIGFSSGLSSTYDAGAMAAMSRATHFNPVDLVCCLRDYKGGKFNLLKYVDPEAGFISSKSFEGRELKALELPGLWNGAMSDWNTLFVEETFNPVKVVLDLLRPAHQG